MMEDRLNRREAIRRGAILAAAATAGCVPGLRGGATSRRLRDYDIRDFGAVGNGSTSNTRSIQETIDAAAAAGGGNVVVPVGIFLSGAIFLRPGVNLRVDRNGVLRGSLDRADYPLVPTRWEGIERGSESVPGRRWSPRIWSVPSRQSATRFATSPLGSLALPSAARPSTYLV